MLLYFQYITLFSTGLTTCFFISAYSHGPAWRFIPSAGTPGSLTFTTDAGKFKMTIMKREDVEHPPFFFSCAPGMARSALTGAVPVVVVATG
jgi:hypothetical protein